REDLQLQRDGRDDAVRGPEQGPSDAHHGGAHHRHRVHAGDTRRGHHHGLDEPSYPAGHQQLMDVIVKPDPVAPIAAPAASERSQARRETLRALFRRPAFIIGNIVIIGWIICAVLGQRITPYDPFNYFAPGGHLAPSPEHWMGTDRLGRDVLSRVMVGSRDVLIVAPLAALLGVAAGTLLGLIMGYYRGRVDDVLSRLVEAFLALPVILVGLLTLVVLGTSPLVVI